MKQVKDCPKCQVSAGWYEKLVQSYHQYYDADGIGCHATDDGHSRGGVRKYCAECAKDITDCIED